LNKYESALRITVAALRRSPKNPYWCRRLIELFPFCDEKITRRHRQARLRAIAVVASHDPLFLISESPLGVRNRWALAGAPLKAVASLERQVKIKDPSVRGYVLAMLWLAAIPYHSEPAAEIYERAGCHLARVDEPLRDADYWSMLSDCLAHTDYNTLKALAPRVIEHTNPQWRTQRVSTVLAAALARADWKTYDAYRTLYARYAEVHPPSPHDECTVLNLDGIRALRDKGRQLPTIMAELLARAPHVQFLGTPETLRLPNELVARGVHLDWVQRYVALASARGRGPAIDEIARKLVGA
jgi:hypothetical protein